MKGVEVVFERIVCGVHGTEEAFEAARQIAKLAPTEAELTLVDVVNPTEAAPAGVAATITVADVEEAAGNVLDRARAEVSATHAVETRLVEDAFIPGLLEFAKSKDATLIAVGIHGHSRAAGIALGRVPTAVLHEAPCSVYVARPSGDGELFPEKILAGFDGSASAEPALSVARELADRTGADLRVLCAGGGEIDTAPAREALASVSGSALLVDDRHPVEALTNQDAQIIVIGSRGLHGVKALGSVSERVAHQADCSVLVVR